MHGYIEYKVQAQGAFSSIHVSMPGKITPNEFLTKHFPKIDHEKKAKILKLHDRAEDLKKLDNKTFGELLSKNPLMIMWKKANSDTESRIFRIFCGNMGNEVTDDVLSNAFKKYASFSKAKVVRDKKTMKSRGYGLVSLLKVEDYIKAMREM